MSTAALSAVATAVPAEGVRWIRRFLASFDEVPTVGLHAVTSATLALVSCFVALGGIVSGRAIDVAALIAVFTFDLGYLTKTSYDFHKKRTTDRETQVARALAERTDPPATIATNSAAGTVSVREAVTAAPSSPPEGAANGVTNKPAVPADLATALRGGSAGGAPTKAADEGLG